MPPDIRALTAAIRAGDPAALERLYRDRFDPLLAMARSRTGRDESFCLDVVQETFLRVIRKLPILADEAQLDAWLLRTLERCALDAFRRDIRRGRREAALEQPPSEAAGAREARGEHPRLSSVLSRLSPDEIDLLVGRFRFGWTLREIGASLGVAPGAVDGRITRLLERLRRDLVDDPA